MHKLTSSLFAFQKKAIDSVKNKEWGGLFLEQGLGKSICAASISLHWLQRGYVDSVLIFTKKTLVSNWANEFSGHTNYTPITPSFSSARTTYRFFPKGGIYILHFQSLEKEAFRLNLLFRNERIGIIIDEAHFIKNPFSKAATSLFRLGDQAKRKLILTGTPIPNRPYDLWALCRFLKKDMLGDLSFASLKRDFEIPRQGTINNYSSLQKRLESIRSILSENIVFIQKDNSGLELPPKEYVFKTLSMDNEQRSLYLSYLGSERNRRELKNALSSHRSPAQKSKNVLKKISDLLVCSSCPSYLKPGFSKITSKEKELLKLCKSLLLRKKQLIVWTYYQFTAKRLLYLLEPYGAVCVTGGTRTEIRNKLIESFKRGGSSILIATMGSCKEGLNLQNASDAVFFDSSLRLDDISQAQDRIHRINQKKKCTMYFLITRNSIEEWANALLKVKRFFSDEVFSRNRVSQVSPVDLAEILSRALR